MTGSGNPELNNLRRTTLQYVSVKKKNSCRARASNLKNAIPMCKIVTDRYRHWKFDLLNSLKCIEKFKVWNKGKVSISEKKLIAFSSNSFALHIFFPPSYFFHPISSFHLYVYPLVLGLWLPQHCQPLHMWD